MEQICKVSSNKSNTNILLKIIRYMISLKIYFYVLIYLYFCLHSRKISSDYYMPDTVVRARDVVMSETKF